MLVAVFLAACLAASQAIVCIPELCQNVHQTPLDCKGSIIKNGGFCGCSDVCAKVEGEACSGQATVPLMGMLPIGKCDSGLLCKVETVFGHGSCVKQPVKRSMQLTACQQLRRLRMISMVVWKGQWTPNCDEKGAFLPQQCDNTGTCFCVHTDTGVKIEGTSILGGPASC